MTPDNIDTEALRELEAKATPGPWKWAVGEGDPQIEGNLEYPESSPVLVARGCGNKKASEAGVLGCMPEKLGDPLRACPMHPCGIDRELIVALRNAAPALLDEIDALKVAAKAIQADRDRLLRLNVDLVNERDSLKAEVEAERNEARGYREQFKTAVGHYTTLRARLGLDGFATVEEVLRKVDTLRSKLSASEADVERLRAALASAHADLASDGGVSERDCECDDCAALRGEESPRG